MPTGIVRWFNEQKGYGFIKEDGTDRDIFCHYSDLDMPGFKTLAENEKVEFVVVKTDKGNKAQQIKRLAVKA